MSKILSISIGILYLLHGYKGLSQTSSLVYYGQDNNLVYRKDAKENRIPDFSSVGYMNGEVQIPSFPIVKEVSPGSGDDRLLIQSAIDEVEERSPDINGFRGAILLKAGEYQVGNTLTITSSGVALIGEGSGPSGTRIIATKKEQYDLIRFHGSGGAKAETSTAKKTLGDYIPIGETTFTLEEAHSFKVGDRVFLQRKPNQAWIELLNMHTLSQTDPEDSDWTSSGYTINYKRQVVAVDGQSVVLDAPLVDPIEPEYAEAFIMKYTWNGRIENVGIENVRLISEYANETDELHGWNAVKFDNVENGWARNVEAYHFGYAAVNIGGGASNISVLDSKCIDPVSQTTGGRKYSFNVDGERVLVKNCLTRGGRHDYVTGSATPGPNVFTNCTAINQRSNIGPHHRWSTGLLFDNITGNGEMDVENRRNSGSGHGWAGAQTLFWNCTAKSIILQDPPGEHINWAIGNIATVTGKGHYGTFPLGIVESTGSPVIPESLYEAQLADRLGYRKAEPEAPADFKGKALSDSRVHLSWTGASGNESGFFVEKSSDNGQTWNAIETLSAGANTYVVDELTGGTQYQFRVSAKSAFGYSSFSDPISVTTLDKDSLTGMKDHNEKYSLKAYPNPFKRKAIISFSLEKPSYINLTIYDHLGRKIETLMDEYKRPGLYEFLWNPKQILQTGIYIVKLQQAKDSGIIRLSYLN